MITHIRADIPFDENMALVRIRDEVDEGSLNITMFRASTCIGGAIAKQFDKDPADFVIMQYNHRTAYKDLFFPPFWQFRQWFFTPQKSVVRAIDRFMENKNPWPWFWQH